MPAFRALAKRAQVPLADSRSVVRGSGGSGSGAWVFRASKVLHLEYGKLKRMAEAGPAPALPTMAPATFLELVPPRAVGLSECLIELEGPRGTMRIQWKGDTAPDLAALSRILWESA
jgi:hypothetical protein